MKTNLFFFCLAFQFETIENGGQIMSIEYYGLGLKSCPGQPNNVQQLQDLLYSPTRNTYDCQDSSEEHRNIEFTNPTNVNINYYFRITFDIPNPILKLSYFDNLRNVIVLHKMHLF